MTEADRHRSVLPTGLSIFFAPLFAAALSLGLVAVSGDETSPPRELNVADGARPIWSPTRVPGHAADTSQPASGTASTLRFVQAGWGGQSAPSESTRSSVVLRWRSRKPTPAFQGEDSTPYVASNTWQDLDQASESPIRPVSHEQTASPFDDPFGDKLVQSAEPEMKLPAFEQSKPKIDEILQPATEPPAPTIEAPKEPSELPFGQIELPNEPARVEPSEPSTEPSESLPELPMEVPTPSGQTEPGEPEPPKLPPGFESSIPPTMEGTDTTKKKPCKRVYNERDCCVEEQKCKRALLDVRQNSIKDISLDITASYQPDAKSLEEEQTEREKKLRLMPAREWRNRAGQVIADGELTDLRNRRAIIADDDGNVTEIRFGELSDDDLCFLAAWWGVPTECTLGDDKFAYRQWEPVTFTWKASALCHKPLYFEERQLERYGHTTGPFFQPVLSGAHFFLNVAVLPYKMGINPPNECQYALGYYRPGSCSPWLLPPVPLSVRGGLMEAGAITGLIFLFP